jgi:hypothetical protein
MNFRMNNTKIGKIYNYLKHISLSRLLLAFMHNGYLVEIGWFKSYRKKEAIDINGYPIPWTTYSFIEFIKCHLKSNMELFEYGSGNPTLFFADRVKNVMSVEHNKEWYERVRSRLPQNVELSLVELSDEYENSILKHKKNFDVIIIAPRYFHNKSTTIFYKEL